MGQAHAGLVDHQLKALEGLLIQCPLTGLATRIKHPDALAADDDRREKKILASGYAVVTFLECRDGRRVWY